jgi:outer membrane protein TolC
MSAAIFSDRIGLAKMAQDLADGKLVLAKTQFQFGTSTVQDLIVAQNDSAKAASDYLAAKADYLVKELDLETAMGL